MTVNRMRYEKGSFTQVPNIQHLASLTPVAQALYLWICVHADDKGFCFPSRKTLAEKIGYQKPSSIDRYIKELRCGGFIEVVKRKGEQGRNQSNVYKMLLIAHAEDGEYLMQEFHGLKCEHEGCDLPNCMQTA